MTLKSYPFLRIALFFISGISLPFLYPVAVWAILVIAAIALALFLGGNILKSTLFSATGMYVALICAGSLIASYELQKSPLPFPEQTQAYTVRIKSATESKPKSYKVIAEVISIRTPDRWQSSGSEVLLYFQKTDAPPPVYGDVFLIHDAPREIEGPKNPLEFDYKSFQERRGIKTHHFLRDSDYVRLGHKPEYPWMSAIYNWNRAAGETLRERISSSDDAGIAEAMLTGTRDHIETELNTAYASTGSVHVLAVSGMHVGIILLILRFLLKPLRNLPGGRFYFGIISNLIIWLYAVFTGLSPSVVRATFMFSLFEMGSMFHQRRNSINILAASAVILLIFKPAWLFEVGFQLSYLAIFGILFLYEPLRSLFEPKYKLIKWFWEITVVSIAAQVFTLPLILYYFHQIPNYSLLSNPLVAVGSTLVLGSGIPAVLLSKIPFLGDLAAFILIWTLKIMNFSVKYIANLPHATSTGFSIGLIEVFMLFLLVFLLSFLFLKKEFRLLPVILFLSGSLFIYNMIQDLGQMKQKEITYHFIPRGSGISLIDSKEALFLCDSITEINPRAYSFHLKNYYDDRGIRTYSTKKPADSSQILAFEFSGSRNLWIKARNYRQIKERFDRVMISNNAVWQIDRQFEIFPDQIILDDTNSRKRISLLKAQADSLGIELIALYDTGGITFTY